MNTPKHCQACGHPARAGEPIVLVAVEPMPGWGRSETTAWIHESHTTDPAPGFYDAEV